jgi:hypothetical protein
VVTLSVKRYKVTKICQEHGIREPLINVLDDHPQHDGKTIFGRAMEYGVVNMYRGSFEAAYRGALTNAPTGVTPEALLKTFSTKATHVLLHELWHCKQLEEKQYEELTVEQAEVEAASFATSNEHLWPSLVTLKDE